MSSHLRDYHYDLPPELVAARPLADRTASRMLVLHRKSGEIEHRLFTDFPNYVRSNDLVVLNDSKVIPARLYDALGKIEILLLEKKDPLHWIAMVRPGRKMKLGATISIAGTTAIVCEIFTDGTRLLKFETAPDLKRHGRMPIPPYFKRDADEEDRLRYQTTFAREEGSVAAPTAGLHFTPEILEKISHAFLTLHVGAGTFLPVKNDDLSMHQMHQERYSISEQTAYCLNQRLMKRPSGGRVIAVGTTSSRVLESQPLGKINAITGSTDIFIRPPYQFKNVDALLTNFHFPASTLLMLVSAMAGRELILETYNIAVQEKYRFFSYGDCMLIL
ncbi:MAG: tRNA preQ1(34) S-adenosylmethionine ribosyltransferase-isomerase QueA [Chthoniobacterales bacterium]